ncbi:MAG TPA: hypothetical protein VF429_01780, partial [Anaerolineae bacterium]
EWSSGMPFPIATHVRMTLAAEAGGTRLDREYGVEVRLPLVGEIAAAFLTRNTPHEMRGLVERIKQAAENERGHPALSFCLASRGRGDPAPTIYLMIL